MLGIPPNRHIGKYVFILIYARLSNEMKRMHIRFPVDFALSGVKGRTHREYQRKLPWK